MNTSIIQADFLIIGSGAAGLHAALHASRYGKVVIVTKSGLETSSSYQAQGGVAAVLNSSDSFASHIHDTFVAGRELCHPRAVDLLVKEGAQCVQKLIEQGMQFDMKDGALALGLEGGHSNRRVLHADGAETGKALVSFLVKRVKKQANIEIIEHAFVHQLATSGGVCTGAEAYCYSDDRLLHVHSSVIVLATGGYSGLYQRTTNPHTSVGDGLWLGYNAGTSLQDLEFVQFHPTAFYDKSGTTFLISEAVRGEGARLYNQAGERFMSWHPQKELAPRDVVSQEIYEQIQKQSSGYVFLDIQHLDVARMRSHFPSLIKKIEQHNIDIETEGIPVAPAAHYCIGGIRTDLNAKTSVKNLYACGEVAATGAHGANRLASNSLLECLVFSKRAISHAANASRIPSQKNAPEESFTINRSEKDAFLTFIKNVSETLSKYVGIRRNKTGLDTALDIFESHLAAYPDKAEEYYMIRSLGLLKIARLITVAARQRKESRGVHTRTDYPDAHSKTEHFSYNRLVS